MNEDEKEIGRILVVDDDPLKSIVNLKRVRSARYLGQTDMLDLGKSV
jgi:hypothetical protein